MAFLSANSEMKKDNDKKIFCGGIDYSTTPKEIEDYFSKFGTVSKVSLKTDKMTGRSRGFAFVTFEEKEAVIGVMAEKNHRLGDRKIEPKQAIGPEPLLKIFVGGMNPSTTEDDIRNIFGEYGAITEIHIATDKVTKKPRGFAFITYEEEDSADKASEQPKQELCGKKVDVKKALPQNDNNSRGGGRGGYGGGYSGGYGGGYGGGWYGDYGYGGYGGSRGYNDGYYNDSYGYDSQGYDSYDSYQGGYGGYGTSRGRGNFGYHPYSR